MPYVVMPKIDNLLKMVKTMESVAKSKRSGAIATEVKKELEELIQYAKDLTQEVNGGKASSGYDVEVEDGYYPVEAY